MSSKHSSAPAVGFRRNIKWFLAALVGFLITLILVLLLLLQTVVTVSVSTERESRRASLSAAKESIESAGPRPSPVVLDGRLVALRGSLGLAGIELHRPDGSVIRSGASTGESLSRKTSQGTLVLYFEASAANAIRERFLSVAGIVIGSTVLAVILLVLLLPKVVRPIDRMLEDAKELGERDTKQSEDHYLIETFRNSIEKLKAQETELRRLHEFEKARADDLERITSTLTRSLSSGFIALDERGRIVDLNRAAREILSIDESAHAPQPPEEILGETVLSRTIRELFDRREGVTRHELTDADMKVTIGLTTVPLYGEENDFLGMLVLFTDLSGVRELEDRMREMQALADLGQISAGIAHELRNSLGTILGYLKLARRQDDGKKTEEKIHQAESEGLRLSESINALLAFARPVSLEPETTDLIELLANVRERLQHETGSVEIRIEGKNAVVEADRGLLETVFENLLRNAAEAIPPDRDGRIDVDVEPDTEEVMILVRDNGTGIDEDFLPRVFLPFQTGKASGTGLGLALARKIVLLHGGTISIESTQGKGTEVRVELPLK
ncbi:MAG: ATP-binding protein [Thermoanaerobaculia bacterium]|nr:ATP-binding protein [Thermoanaerobaculia bacterium]